MKKIITTSILAVALVGSFSENAISWTAHEEANLVKSRAQLKIYEQIVRKNEKEVQEAIQVVNKENSELQAANNNLNNHLAQIKVLEEKKQQAAKAKEQTRLNAIDAKQVAAKQKQAFANELNNYKIQLDSNLQKQGVNALSRKYKIFQFEKEFKKIQNEQQKVALLAKYGLEQITA